VDLQTEYHNVRTYFYIGGALITDDINFPVLCEKIII